MPHVDEGTLHALLDGALRAGEPDRAERVEAHLAGCADCRARLEAAEDVRGRAAEILVDAAPGDGPTDLAAPDFAEVLARARVGASGAGATGGDMALGDGSGGRPGPGLRRQLTWTRRLGWAASIVLALGTGYLIRDLAGPTDPTEPTGTGDTAAPAEVQERMEVPTVLDTPVPTDARADMSAASGEAETVERRDSIPAASASGDVRTRAMEERVDAMAARPPTPAGTTAARAPGAVVLMADSASRVEQPPQTEYARGERRLPTNWRETGALMEQARRSLPAPDHRRWTAVSAIEAAGTLAGPLYVLPRAELLESYVDRDATRVMTLQRLQTGIPVRVVQSRGGAAAAAGAFEAERDPEAGGAGRGAGAAPSLPAVESARVVRGEFVLELSGALPAALLEMLGETAEPAVEPQGG